MLKTSLTITLTNFWIKLKVLFETSPVFQYDSAGAKQVEESAVCPSWCRDLSKSQDRRCAQQTSPVSRWAVLNILVKLNAAHLSDTLLNIQYMYILVTSITHILMNSFDLYYEVIL